MVLNVVTVSINTVMIGILFAAFIPGVSYRVKFLTLSGTIATFLSASFIFGLGGIKWSIPIPTFFILSSILSKLRKKKNAEVEMYFEKSDIRDHSQVIANGGLGGILVIINTINPNKICYMIYLATDVTHTVEVAPNKIKLSCPNALIGHPFYRFPLKTCLPAAAPACRMFSPPAKELVRRAGGRE